MKNEVSYYLQTGFDENGNKVNWPEMFVMNYIKRPEILESVCLYEFVQKYEVKYFSEKDKRSSNEILFFTIDHPGYKYAYVKKREKEVIPMISTDISFPDLQC